MAFFIDIGCSVYLIFPWKEVIELQDEFYMSEALRVAKNALGRTSPNPLVGAVIVKDGRIIAEGWHRKAGTPHAEIHALNMAGELARGATVYVTLEPCSHYGRTGPCANALVEAGVSRVVVAMLDPNPKVAGRGVNILRDAGIEVVTGVLEDEAKKLNEIFLKWITKEMPFVALKTAMSLDGKIATSTGQSQWITNEASRRRTHELRDCYDGIMVGINTAIKDNPSLTTRLPDRVGRNPIRIVVDSRARLPLDSHLVTDGKAKTIVAVSGAADAGAVQDLRDAGVQVISAGSERVDLPQLLKKLAEMEISSILVEGGGQLNFSMLKAGLVDKVYAFIAPKLIGGREALTPVEGEGFEELSQAVELKDATTELIDGDILITARVDK
ncbi:Diaminohydroxyphosphoribosylaminopyrimidine deaminase [Anaerovibrio sp. JC8]|uniref:bifunctional diaminohydroxyphosphoribosylaminopyrimidine deaminase/5-amino-6-(5-phosphoribosylamino)uracil reductase RibD n=1 Tax=Anaerovibrio sp. JC8 TaxID=1240085 RepID=UPI000A0A63F6|nr:bifunctional diaminohydroxyphosphoribosylaminopyrimidine deaminase/5-amino-6-(5-phosphoribosylamino)uracil reductase RibD [Anaerovibrio sp. JC8]ORU01187.1 Diaminohydroxyphosphoribosylaminopyrimidine deaminase [Anaerovibrio sp. JC8]